MGNASMGTMCDSRSSVGLSQDGGRSLSSVIATAAHELGHIMNMKHDEDHVGNNINILYTQCSIMTDTSYGEKYHH